MLKKFNSLKINKFDDCDKWINEMQMLRIRLKDTHNKTYDEDDLLTTLYKNLPEGHIYSSLKVSFMRQLTSTNDKLTLDGFRIQLRMFMRDNLNQSKAETAFYSNKNLVCGGCGKYGHKIENFRSQKRVNSIKCIKCGKQDTMNKTVVEIKDVKMWKTGHDLINFGEI